MLILMFLLILVAVLGVVYLASIVWLFFFAATIPSFISGIVGGLAALPVWEGLKKLKNERSGQSQT